MELDPTNSNSVILNSLLFQTRNYFPGIYPSSFTIGYLKLLLFQTIYCFPWKFKTVGFNCTCVHTVIRKWVSEIEEEKYTCDNKTCQGLFLIRLLWTLPYIFYIICLKINCNTWWCGWVVRKLEERYRLCPMASSPVPPLNSHPWIHSKLSVSNSPVTFSGLKSKK